jgi:FkbM family methyltransferase
MKILGAIGAGYRHDPAWKAVRPRYRSYFDRRINSIVSADVAEWGGRYCYYWGRHFDIPHQAVLRKFLSPGDSYIDIGANVGYHSLYASALVGDTGQVLSFEPNPATFSVLASHIGINRIRNCMLFNMAISSAPGEAFLNQLEEHSGTSTLRAVPSAIRSMVVKIERGDDVLRKIQLSGKAVLKIDVEGFEYHVLQGLGETLQRISIVAVEVTPSWILEQGGSAEQLYDYMRRAGFQSFIPTLRWRMNMFAPTLELSPVDHPLAEQHDVLFIRQ